MTTFSIEGKFLTQTLTGTQRYAAEIVRGLDALGVPGEFELVVPKGAELKSKLTLRNIPMVRYGAHSGPRWTHQDFARRCKEVGSTPLCLNNIAPLGSHCVVTIHDVSPRANKAFYGWRYRAYQNTCLGLNTRKAKLVFTDSVFSKSEIERYYPHAAGKIAVIPCAWQHMDGVAADHGALERRGLVGGAAIGSP